MNTVKAEDVKEEMELRMWFGTHSVLRIDPYIGEDNTILNILVFSNGYTLRNFIGNIYRLKKNTN